MHKSIVLAFSIAITLLTVVFTILPLNSLAYDNTVAGIGRYDDNNVFAQILRKEIPASIVFENEYVLAFKDINLHKACAYFSDS